MRIYTHNEHCPSCDGSLIYPQWTWYVPDFIIRFIMDYIGVKLKCTRCGMYWTLQRCG